MKLRWVKSHRGNVHNAMADLLAAEGARRGKPLGAAVPWVHTKEMIDRKFASRGDEAWARNCGKLRVRWTGVNLGPKQIGIIKGAGLAPVETCRLMEVMSRHSSTRRQWSKIERGLTKAFRFCAHPLEDEMHLIYVCSRFAPHRTRLKRKLEGERMPNRLGGFLKWRRSLKALMSFLKDVWPMVEARTGGRVDRGQAAA